MTALKRNIFLVGQRETILFSTAVPLFTKFCEKFGKTLEKHIISSRTRNKLKNLLKIEKFVLMNL